ncbi:uncharacterized protein LOC126015802 [Suncus etruscus]|uniref:uncharacterized protein LOC126015802 n=1 Tax=Suncus etruscus TaxID=109475 RepID=UPI00210FC2AA|nr:uncharacterized protein LOC126015802 [Suncus etruscus]
MPAANMMENLQLPALQVPEAQGAPEGGPAWSSSSTPTLRRRRFKMRRTKNVQEQSLETGLSRDLPGKEFLQLPSIEITPSSDEDTPWSNCSTPSASPRRKRFLLRKWLRVRERKECSDSRRLLSSAQPTARQRPKLQPKVELSCLRLRKNLTVSFPMSLHSSQQSSQQSSHDDDSSRFLSPRGREESFVGPSWDDGNVSPSPWAPQTLVESMDTEEHSDQSFASSSQSCGLNF